MGSGLVWSCKRRKASGNPLPDAALPARGKELVAWLPAWQLRIVGDIGPDGQTERGHLFHARKIPVVVVLVGGLMVVLAVVLLEHLGSELQWFADVIGPGIDRERWNANTRQGEVVGAVVVALARL